MKQLKTLKQVQKYLSKIPNIGRGGCGVSALAMYRWLKKNKDVGKTKFVFLYSSGDEEYYLDNKIALRDKNGNEKACSHCCIINKDKFIDCNGKVYVEIYKWVQIIGEVGFINRSLNNRGTWNEKFDRDCILEIAEKLNIDLSDIERF